MQGNKIILDVILTKISSNFRKSREKTEHKGRKRPQNKNSLLERKIWLCFLAVSVLA